MRTLATALLALVLTPAGTALAQGCVTFDDVALFEEYCLTHGKLLKFIETFEESNIEPGGKQPLPAPLDMTPNVVGGVGFPSGLEADNLIIQDNITPGPNPPMPNPSYSSLALFVIGPGFINTNSEKVGEDMFLEQVHASLDLIFTERNHTGVGFLLSRFEGYPNAGWTVSIWDKTDTMLGSFQVPPPPGPEPTKQFWGVWCDQTIGRINIYDEAGATPDAIDDIQLWWEFPTPTDAVSWGVIKSRL